MHEFLHVNYIAAASIYVMQLDSATYLANTQPMLSHINVGTGEDCTIKELVETMSKVVGYEGINRLDSYGIFVSVMNSLNQHELFLITSY